MRARKIPTILLGLILMLPFVAGCRKRSDAFSVALSDQISTLDPIGSPTIDAAAERVRVLMFNTLVRKNEKYDYVPDLATNIQRSDDGLSYTFTLHDGVTFHDGRKFTSEDAKYTIDALLASNSGKAASFFEGSGAAKQSFIKSVEATDPLTLKINLTKPWLGLLSNLVAIGIIPKDSAPQQKSHPIGTGPFKFVSFDSSQQIVDLEAFPNYWEGAPQIQKLRVRVINEANALQAELRSGRIDIAPLPTNLSSDAIISLGKDPNLKVEQFNGSNLNLITFNTESAPLDNVRVRQAIAYAIDREALIRDLLLGQGKLAHSIIPEESWAYSSGKKYSLDREQAKKLLDEAGFKDPDGDGPQMRFQKPISFKISSASVSARQYAGVIQNDLKQIGIPISIETAELNTMRDQLRLGQFQMTYTQWVGGNQDPIFYKDLFASSEIPTQERPSKNRSRYRNKELDALLEEAVNTADHEKARVLYAKIQDIVSNDLPVLPLWYQANMVVAKKSVGNIKVDGSGTWDFVKNLSVSK
ncbi:MAG: ABC transporter substrate-binding protein [Pyrinomonadaceae bacterium]